MAYRKCNFCGALAEYTHRDGTPVCKCSNKDCAPGRDRWLTYDEFEELKPMGFSNQCITPKFKDRPHIVKLQGRWRVSPYDHKGLWRTSIRIRWDEAHALARKLNEAIDREVWEAKERQRLWYRMTHQPKSSLDALL